MPQPAGPPELDLEVAALKERYAGLRQAAAMPGADARAVLEAAFAELDTAVDVLGAMRAGPRTGPAARSLLLQAFPQVTEGRGLKTRHVHL